MYHLKMDIANQIGWTLLASEKLADMEKKRHNDELQPGAYFSGGRGGDRPPQTKVGARVSFRSPNNLKNQ